MNTKSTWTWLVVTATVFAFIFFFERHWKKPPPGLPPLLSDFQASNVTYVRLLPPNQDGILLQRTNGSWFLTRPINFPAHRAKVEVLLTNLESQLPARVIAPAEMRQRAKADEEFGFDNPILELELRQGDRSDRLKFGRLTAPGSQVFVRVVGREDVYVMDAALLQLLPTAPPDWRDTQLLDLRTLDFDRLNVTNAGKLLGFQWEPTNQVWRMTDPMAVRANSDRINALLLGLQNLSIASFVSDKTNADLESFGLSPASLSLNFAKGTNAVAGLHFGHTNDAGQFFARRDGLGSVVSVPGEALAQWRESVSVFRDPRLIAVPAAVTEIEVRAGENFTLQRSSSNRWQLAGSKLPVDAGAVGDFFRTLETFEITQYLNAVTDAELAKFGLTAPVYQVHFKLPGGAATNGTGLQLAFGATNGESLYARRSDELSVYTVNRALFQRLPAAGWQLRERTLWRFAPEDVARLTIRQDGRTRELISSGTNSWALAPGSQGIINVGGVVFAVRELCQPVATAWNAHGEAARDARFGLTTNSLAITLELRRGDKFDLQFGALSPDQYPYARVTLDGEPWVFECSHGLAEYVLFYLSIPASAP